MPKTAKQLYKDLQTELHKVNAPALKLYDFNYYANKAVMQYVNLMYSMYDTTQQTTDDLRVLQSSVRLTPEKVSDYEAAYECTLPMDYLHMLNCICTFEMESQNGCYAQGTCVQKPATKLVSDAWPTVMEDYYNRPSFRRPYFRIYNQNVSSGNRLPVDPVTLVEDAESGAPETTGTDINGVYGVETFDSDTLASGENPGSNQKRTFTFSNGHKESLVERTAAQRYGNLSNVRLEILYGENDPDIALKEVRVDYIRVPQYIRLTQEQLDLRQDTSQLLEFPDYVCQEITNILVRLILELESDPRLSGNMQINQTIARPQAAQQQASASA